jgi:hypothetical protein
MAERRSYKSAKTHGFSKRNKTERKRSRKPQEQSNGLRMQLCPHTKQSFQAKLPR